MDDLTFPKPAPPARRYFRDFVEAGGLMSYGVDRRDVLRRAATHVDKLLKGARPADLSLRSRPPLLRRADQVIELGRRHANTYSMSLLTELRRCGELDGGVDGVTIWLACDCGVGITRRADEGDALDVNG